MRERMYLTASLWLHAAGLLLSRRSMYLFQRPVDQLADAGAAQKAGHRHGRPQIGLDTVDQLDCHERVHSDLIDRLVDIYLRWIDTRASRNLRDQPGLNNLWGFNRRHRV